MCVMNNTISVVYTCISKIFEFRIIEAEMHKSSLSKSLLNQIKTVWKCIFLSLN